MSCRRRHFSVQAINCYVTAITRFTGDGWTLPPSPFFSRMHSQVHVVAELKNLPAVHAGGAVGRADGLQRRHVAHPAERAALQERGGAGGGLCGGAAGAGRGRRRRVPAPHRHHAHGRARARLLVARDERVVRAVRAPPRLAAHVAGLRASLLPGRLGRHLALRAPARGRQGRGAAPRRRRRRRRAALRARRHLQPGCAGVRVGRPRLAEGAHDLHAGLRPAAGERVLGGAHGQTHRRRHAPALRLPRGGRRPPHPRPLLAQGQLCQQPLHDAGAGRGAGAVARRLPPRPVRGLPEAVADPRGGLRRGRRSAGDAGAHGRRHAGRAVPRDPRRLATLRANVGGAAAPAALPARRADQLEAAADARGGRDALPTQQVGDQGAAAEGRRPRRGLRRAQQALRGHPRPLHGSARPQPRRPAARSRQAAPPQTLGNILQPLRGSHTFKHSLYKHTKKSNLSLF